MENANYSDGDLLKATGRDVYLVAYPKAGVTWMTEVLTAIYSQYAIENPSKAEEYVGAIRAHGFCTSCPLSRRHSTKSGMSTAGYDVNGNAVFQDEESHHDKPRRLISLHFPASRMESMIPEAFTNKGVKMIYVLRNPKDVAVSYFHFHKMNDTLPTPESWEEFFEDFISGGVRWGSWFDHVTGWWQKYLELRERNPNKLLVVTFESLKKNIKEEVARIAAHVGIELSWEGLDEVCHRCTFASMKKDPRRNHSQYDIYKGDFLRKGKVGDWQNQFTTEQSQRFDKAMYMRLGKDLTQVMDLFVK